MRFSGNNWHIALAKNYSAVAATVRSMLANATQLPEEFVRVNKLSVGSLIVDVTFTRNASFAIPDAVLRTIVSTPDTAILQEIYVALTNSTDRIVPLAILSAASRPENSACGSSCVIIITATIGAAFFALLVCALVAVIYNRRKESERMSSLPGFHKRPNSKMVRRTPYGDDADDNSSYHAPQPQRPDMDQGRSLPLSSEPFADPDQGVWLPRTNAARRPSPVHTVIGDMEDPAKEREPTGSRKSSSCSQAGGARHSCGIPPDTSDDDDDDDQDERDQLGTVSRLVVPALSGTQQRHRPFSATVSCLGEGHLNSKHRDDDGGVVLVECDHVTSSSRSASVVKALDDGLGGLDAATRQRIAMIAFSGGVRRPDAQRVRSRSPFGDDANDSLAFNDGDDGVRVCGAKSFLSARGQEPADDSDDDVAAKSRPGAAVDEVAVIFSDEDDTTAPTTRFGGLGVAMRQRIAMMAFSGGGQRPDVQRVRSRSPFGDDANDSLAFNDGDDGVRVCGAKSFLSARGNEPADDSGEDVAAKSRPGAAVDEVAVIFSDEDDTTAPTTRFGGLGVAMRQRIAASLSFGDRTRTAITAPPPPAGDFGTWMTSLALTTSQGALSSAAVSRQVSPISIDEVRPYRSPRFYSDDADF
jgi:hypothetical protein